MHPFESTGGPSIAHAVASAGLPSLSVGACEPQPAAPITTTASTAGTRSIALMVTLACMDRADPELPSLIEQHDAGRERLVVVERNVGTGVRDLDERDEMRLVDLL